MKRALASVLFCASCSSPAVGPDPQQTAVVTALGVAPAGNYYGMFVLDDPGLWISVSGPKSASRGIWEVQKDGSGKRLVVPLANDAADVHFAVDATHVYFAEGSCEVFRVEKTGGTPTSLGKAGTGDCQAKGLLLANDAVLLATDPGGNPTPFAPKTSESFANQASQISSFPKAAGGGGTALGDPGGQFICDRTRACMTVLGDQVFFVHLRSGPGELRALPLAGGTWRSAGTVPSLNTLAGLVGRDTDVFVALTDRAPSLRCVVVRVAADGSTKTLFDGPYLCGDPKVDATNLYIGVGTDEAGGVGVLRQPTDGAPGKILPLGRADFMPRFVMVGPAAFYAAGTSHLVRVSLSAFSP